MNKLAVCVYIVAGVLSVSANSGGWSAYGDADLGGHGATQTVLLQSAHGGCGCGCGGGGWADGGGAGAGWAAGAGGWAGGAGGDGGAGGAGGAGGCGEPAATVKHLKPIVVSGKKAKIIEHHSRPIYIRPTVTRFVVPAAPVVIKPVLIHKPSSVSIRPKLLTSSAPSQCLSPVLLRVIKNIEEPSTQRTVIVEKSAPSSSCNIEASGGFSTGGGSGCGCGCGGAHGH